MKLFLAFMDATIAELVSRRTCANIWSKIDLILPDLFTSLVKKKENIKVKKLKVFCKFFFLLLNQRKKFPCPWPVVLRLWDTTGLHIKKIKVASAPPASILCGNTRCGRAFSRRNYPGGPHCKHQGASVIGLR